MAELKLALRPDELRRITEGLGREPTRVELYAFDAQWSEHCSYKSSRHLLKQLPTTGPNVVVGPGEDAGILRLGEHNGEQYCVVVAHESHNHPSQVVPFEGAATGVGGIVRDVLCMGAEVIGIADCLRFGRVEGPESHQRYVAQQVVDGIAAYGNAIGVPNVAGDVYFDEGFNDNCLVNVIALGLVKEKDIIHSRAPSGSAGWDIVLVGKATDASGFGGASFSSLSLDEADQEANKGAVQVPDPFLKNVIMRATYRVFEYLREKKITAGFKDLGAGGIMGCTAELCAAGGYGAIIDLDDVNVAVENLPPEVIAVGETQERLCWVLPGEATGDVLRIYNEEFSLPDIARGACAVVIGAVQNEKRYVMRHGSDIVMDVPIDFLTGTIHDEVPEPIIEPLAHRESPRISAREIQGLLPRVLAHRDVCSREPLFKEYDAVVRGTTVIPRGHGSAGVIAPIEGARLGVALAVSGNPRCAKVDPAIGASQAVLEAMRSVVAVGARPLGLTDCLNFGNPRKADDYSQLVKGVAGLNWQAELLGLPFSSGNVSLYNESSSAASVPGSAIVACVGVIDDLKHVITMELKSSQSSLYYIGLFQPGMKSSIAADVLNVTEGLLPIDPEQTHIEHSELVLGAARMGLVLAAQSVGKGGLLSAAAQMAFAAENRFSIEMYEAPGVDPVEWFFGESGGWLMVVADAAAFEEFARNSVGDRGWRPAGKTAAPEVSAAMISTEHAAWALADLYRAWSEPLTEVYG